MRCRTFATVLFVTLLIGAWGRVSCGQGLPYTIEIIKQHCVVPTDDNASLGIGNDRDEVTIEIIKVFKNVLFKSVLPRCKAEGKLVLMTSDDSISLKYRPYECHNYYEWKRGWHDHWTDRHQQPVAPPLIGEGWLEPGEEAEFRVLVREQDGNVYYSSHSKNESLDKMIDAIRLSPIPRDPRTKEMAPLLDDWINSERDIIGGFTVIVRNEGGKLQQKWQSGIFMSLADNGSVPENPTAFDYIERGDPTGFYHATVRTMEKTANASEAFIVAKGTHRCHYNFIARAAQESYNWRDLLRRKKCGLLSAEDRVDAARAVSPVAVQAVEGVISYGQVTAVRNTVPLRPFMTRP